MVHCYACDKRFDPLTAEDGAECYDDLDRMVWECNDCHLAHLTGTPGIGEWIRANAPA